MTSFPNVLRMLPATLLTATVIPASAFAQEAVTLRLPWLLSVQGAGYVMAEAKGFYDEAGLDVTIEPGGPNLNSTALVASGANTFGTNDVNNIILGATQGMDLVMVAACFQKHPGGIITLESSGIATPADLAGRTLAYSEGGPWTLTRAMLTREGVSLDDIELVVSGSSELLISGEVDAKTGFAVNEPVAIELAGHPTNIILPGDYGIRTYAEVIFTTRDYLEANPETVRAFVAATVKGYEYAYANPDETVAAVVEMNDQLDPVQQAGQFALQRDYVITAETEANGLCSIDPAVIQGTLDLLKEFDGLETDLDVSTIFTTEFLPTTN